MNSIKVSTLLYGKCPECNGVISEIELEHQYFKKRVLCLDCKRCSDGHTFGEAYFDFLQQIDLQEE